MLTTNDAIQNAITTTNERVGHLNLFFETINANHDHTSLVVALIIPTTIDSDVTTLLRRCAVAIRRVLINDNDVCDYNVEVDYERNVVNVDFLPERDDWGCDCPACNDD